MSTKRVVNLASFKSLPAPILVLLILLFVCCGLPLLASTLAMVVQITLYLLPTIIALIAAFIVWKRKFILSSDRVKINPALLALGIIIFGILCNTSNFLICNVAGDGILNNKTEKQASIPTITNQPRNSNTSSSSYTITPTPELKEYKVIQITDGDTITIETIGKIRLIGIDSPESTNSQECFGNEAKLKITELIDNKNVTIELDPSQGEKDKYDRTLAFVYVKGAGESINYQMIRTGYAFEYTYDKAYKYQELFKKAQEEAKNEINGLWAVNSCNGLRVFSTSTPAPQVLIVENNESQTKFACNCSKTCEQMSSCEEAQYQLNVCGCSIRDGDKDGIACNGAPMRCR